MGSQYVCGEVSEYLLCNARCFELCWLSDTMREYENLHADCSGFKNGLFGIDEVQDSLIQSRLIYGSLAPLLCMKSAILLLDRANIAQAQRGDLFCEELFGVCRAEQRRERRVMHDIKKTGRLAFW